MISSSDVSSILQGDREAAMKKLPFAFELYRQFVAAKSASETALPVDSFRKRFEWGEVECSIVHGRAKLTVTAYPAPQAPPTSQPEIEVVKEAEDLIVRERTCLKIFAHISRMTKTVWPFCLGYKLSPQDFSNSLAIAAVDMETFELLAIDAIPTDLTCGRYNPFTPGKWEGVPSIHYQGVPPIHFQAVHTNFFGGIYNGMIRLSIPGVDGIESAELVERTSVPMFPPIPDDFYDIKGRAIIGVDVIDTGSVGILPEPFRNYVCDEHKITDWPGLCHKVYDEAQCASDTYTYFRFTFYDRGVWINPYQTPGPPTVRCHTIGEHEFYFDIGDGYERRVQGMRFPFGGMHFSGMIAWTDSNKLHIVEPFPMNMGVIRTVPFYGTGSGFCSYYHNTLWYPYMNFNVDGYSFFMNQLCGNLVVIGSENDDEYITLNGSVFVASAFAGQQPTVPIDEIPENITVVDHIKAVVGAAVVASGDEVRTIESLPPELAENPDSYYWAASDGINEFDVKTRRGVMHLPPMGGMYIGAVLTKERAVYKRTKPSTHEPIPSTEAQDHGA